MITRVQPELIERNIILAREYLMQAFIYNAELEKKTV